VHARAQTVRRFGGAALAELGRIPEHGPKNAKLNDLCFLALERLLRYLALAPPRSLSARHGAPVLLFVDGSADPDPSSRSGFRAGIGCCLLDPSSRRYLWFGGWIPQDILLRWTSGGAKHVIAQAELLPTLMLRRTFRSILGSRPCLCFVDNEAARAGLVKGSSSNVHSAELLEEISNEDIACQTLLWYARVPSASNLADAPSRGMEPSPLLNWSLPERQAADFSLLPSGPSPASVA